MPVRSRSMEQRVSVFVLIRCDRRVRLEKVQNGRRVVRSENVGVGLSHRDRLIGAKMSQRAGVGVRLRQRSLWRKSASKKWIRRLVWTGNECWWRSGTKVIFFGVCSPAIRGLSIQPLLPPRYDSYPSPAGELRLRVMRVLIYGFS